MSVFADSSALVKLYADEEHAERIRALPAVIVSELARVEVPSALWKKQRMGEIKADEVSVLLRDFEADLLGTATEQPRFAGVRLSDRVLRDAARLVGVHGLRAYDAVQLGSAIAARSADPQCVSMAAFDRSLRDAASAEGFELVPGTPDS